MTSMRLRDRAHAANSRTAATQRARRHRAPRARVPGRVEQHERHRALAEALLVARGRHHDRVGVGVVEPRRQARAPPAARPPRARSSGCSDSRSAASRPERDRLAVAVAGVSGDGLDRVADRVAQVEDLAHAGVALVLGDDRAASCARRRRSPRGRRAGPRADPLPQLAAGDQRGLDHLGVSGRQLLRRAAWPASRCRRSPPTAGGRRRRSSWPRPGRRRSCRRRPSRPGPPAWSAPGRSGRRAGRWPRRTRRDRRRRRRRARRPRRRASSRAGELGPHDLGVRDVLDCSPGMIATRPRQRLQVLAEPAADVAVGDQEPAPGDGGRPEPLRGRAARRRCRPGSRPTRSSPTAAWCRPGIPSSAASTEPIAVRALARARPRRPARRTSARARRTARSNWSRSRASGRPLPRQRCQASSNGDVEPEPRDGRASAARTRGGRSRRRRAPAPSGVAEQLERDLLLGGAERGLAVLRRTPRRSACPAAARSRGRRRSRSSPSASAALRAAVDLPAPMKPMHTTERETAIAMLAPEAQRRCHPIRSS